jgi:ABC-2 type transport system permease protein
MGMWNILNYLGWSFFGSNLLALESKVLDGSFDYILLKPLSSSWLSAFGDFFFHNFVTSLSGVILILYYVVLKWNSLSLMNMLLGLLALVVGFVIWYSIYLFFASFTISKPRNGFLSVAKELLGVTRYPIDIFGEQFKIIFYTVIPIAFLTTVPASIVLGRVSWVYIPMSLIIAVILLFISHRFWLWNIKGYTSASS